MSDTDEKPTEEQPETIKAVGRGMPPRKRFFLKAQWRLIENGPEIIARAAKETMGVAAILSGIYLAALQMAKPTPPSPPLPVSPLLLFLPYVPWIGCFLCAWVAFRPDRLWLYEDSPENTRQELVRLANVYWWWLKTAEILLVIGLVVMIVCGYVMFALPGEVAQ